MLCKYVNFKGGAWGIFLICLSPSMIVLIFLLSESLNEFMDKILHYLILVLDPVPSSDLLCF